MTSCLSIRQAIDGHNNVLLWASKGVNGFYELKFSIIIVISRIMMMIITMSIISLIKATYHSNLFWLWNVLRLLSILWWKTCWLIANCLERHRATGICLSSQWIAVERLGLNCNTTCLHWNSNRGTIHTLNQCITTGAARKSSCLLGKMKKI